MVIFQVDDLAHTSRRIAQLGRVATSFGYKIGEPIPKPQGKQTSAIVQWHPKDFGTLMETEEQWPPGSGAEGGAWLPAGKRWHEKYRTRSSSVAQEFAAIAVAVQEPEQMAAKWAEALECPLISRTTMKLTGGEQTVRFVPMDAQNKGGVVAIDVYAAPGKPKAFTGEILLHGVRWRLVDREGAAPTKQLYERIQPKL
jgi:hypothetical protein